MYGKLMHGDNMSFHWEKSIIDKQVLKEHQKGNVAFNTMYVLVALYPLGADSWPLLRIKFP